MIAFFLTGSVTICPECGSDQVVQLAGPHSSTPINNSSIQGSDISLQINQSLQELSKVSEAVWIPLFPLPWSLFAQIVHLCLRMTVQMLALAVAPFLKPAPLQRIPPLSRPGAAPSSSEMLRVTSRASPPTQTARVKTACSGATATPPQVLHRLSSTLHQLGDPHRTVSLSDGSEAGLWTFLHKRHSECTPLLERTAVWLHNARYGSAQLQPIFPPPTPS